MKLNNQNIYFKTDKKILWDNYLKGFGVRIYNSGYLEVVKGHTGRANTYKIIYQTNYKVSVWVPHNINTHEGVLNN